MVFDMKKIYILITTLILGINACYNFQSQEEIEECYANYWDNLLQKVTHIRTQLTSAYPQRTYITQTNYLEETLTLEEINEIKATSKLIKTWVENSKFIKALIIFSIEQEKNIFTILTSNALLLSLAADRMANWKNFLATFLTFLCKMEDQRLAHLLLEEYETNTNFRNILFIDLNNPVKHKHIYHIHRCIRVEIIYQILQLRSTYKNLQTRAQSN